MSEQLELIIIPFETVDGYEVTHFTVGRNTTSNAFTIKYISCYNIIMKVWQPQKATVSSNKKKMKYDGKQNCPRKNLWGKYEIEDTIILLSNLYNLIEYCLSYTSTLVILSANNSYFIVPVDK